MLFKPEYAAKEMQHDEAEVMADGDPELP